MKQSMMEMVAEVREEDYVEAEVQVSKRQVAPEESYTSRDYAHQQNKHTQLISDLAHTDRNAISTQNWRESIRKKYSIHKFLKFAAPYQLNRKIKTFYYFKKGYTTYIPILDPQSSFLTYWKIPILIITILVFIEVPLIIFFGEDFYFTFHTPLYNFFRSFVILMFLLDCFVEFHVAYYNQGALVKNRYKVAQNYLTGSFFFDIVPILLLIITTISYQISQIYPIYMILLLKMQSVYEIDQRFQDKLQSQPKWKSTYMIARMIIEICYLIHFFGCIFFGIGMYCVTYLINPDEGLYLNSWLTYDEGNFGQIIYYGWTYRYILATYWAFATLTTVAYGDIVPMNWYEILFSELGMIAAVFLFAFNVENIQNTFVEYYEEQRKYTREIVAITKFIRSKNVSSETEKEIRNYLEHYFKEKRNRDHEVEGEVMMKLAPQIKAKLLYEAYQKFLHTVPWILGNFSEEFIQDLSQSIVEERFSKKENIFLDGAESTDDNALYFVQVGEIEIFLNVPETDRQEVVLASLKSGAHFGDYSFVTGLSRKASARSRKFSSLAKISRTDFLEKIVQYPRDHQKFSFLRDEVIFNSAYHELGLSCFLCSSTDHMSLECPLGQISIGKEVIRRARQEHLNRKFNKLLRNPSLKRKLDFERFRKKKSSIVFNTELDAEAQAEYFDITQNKILFEAFYSSNYVIIESFQVDKIENYLIYYPEYNFDYLVTKAERRPELVFAAQVKARNVSGVFNRLSFA